MLLAASLLSSTINKCGVLGWWWWLHWVLSRVLLRVSVMRGIFFPFLPQQVLKQQLCVNKSSRMNLEMMFALRNNSHTHTHAHSYILTPMHTWMCAFSHRHNISPSHMKYLLATHRPTSCLLRKGRGTCAQDVREGTSSTSARLHDLFS